MEARVQKVLAPRRALMVTCPGCGVEWQHRLTDLGSAYTCRTCGQGYNLESARVEPHEDEEFERRVELWKLVCAAVPLEGGPGQRPGWGG